MTRACGWIVAFALLTSWISAADEAVDVIEGLDAVALTRGQEVQGEEGFAVVRGRLRYLFASAENRDAFARDPERYEVRLGGLCARMGGTTLGSPDLWAVHDGGIYLFGTPQCRESFLASPADFLEPAPAPLPMDAEAGRRGAEMIDRAVAAIGGAARLDALAGFQERWDSGGLTVLFPDRLRRETEFSGFGVFAEVLTPAAAFFLLPDGHSGPYVPAQRAELERVLERSVPAILRGRHAASFRAAALDASRVAVEHDGGVYVLGFDPASGRVLSLSYTGRGPSFTFGDIVESYSDFREAGGLDLPFRRDVTWNGEPVPERSVTLSSLVVNGEIDPRLFARPEPAEEVPPPAAKTAAAAASRRVALKPRVPRPLEWPQWGGPHRDFKSDATGLAAAWPADGPPRLWSRELGEGYSAIVAADGVLYTMFRRGVEEVAVALDAATGATRWESAVAAPFSEEYSMQNGEGPHAAPLVEGGRVFVVGATGKLRALDAATGRELWGHDLMAEYGGTLRVNGYACSPLAFDGKVILMVGGPGRAVMAFDQADGAVAWAGGDFKNSASSPLLIDLDGEEQLVAFLYAEVAGFDPRSGALLWSFPHAPEFGLNVSLPVWSADDRLLFISSAYGGGSRALELARTDQGTAVREVWSHERMKIHFSNAIRVGERVYASSGEFGPAPLTALEAATGRILWRDRRFARASFLWADGRFVLIDENGVLALATPGPDGLEVASQVELLTPPARTVPTLVGTTLYVRDRKVAMALDLGPLPEPTASR